MITQDVFRTLVRSEFSYLENEFNFSIENAVFGSRQYTVDYRKEELLVRVLFSLTNEFIEVNIYNHISQVKPGEYSWKYSVGLLHLIQKAKTEFDYKKDYEGMMPNKIPIAESIKLIAGLFKNYSRYILEKKQWISWGEILGYEQHVPPGLP